VQRIAVVSFKVKMVVNVKIPVLVVTKSTKRTKFITSRKLRFDRVKRSTKTMAKFRAIYSADKKKRYILTNCLS